MSALLDALIPGDADFPSASAVGLHDAIVAHDRFCQPYAAVKALLPKDFEHGDPVQALKDIEAAEPEVFNALIVGAYSLYYTLPAVAAVIERLTGHTARPPQPMGHPLEPFDSALLTITAARAPHYRPTPKGPDV